MEEKKLFKRNYINTEITAGEIYRIPFTQQERDNSMPLTRLILTNKSSNCIKIYINNPYCIDGYSTAEVITMAPNSMISTDAEIDNIKIYDLAIKNVGTSTIAAGDITINISNF